tara:strand:- start:420 stop:647 length:228 start_codon:yes stop_codon:yes gene_type:complete
MLIKLMENTMSETRETRDYLVRQFTLQVGRRDGLLQDRQTLLSTGELTRDEWNTELDRLNNVVEFLQSEFQRLDN